MEEAIDHYQQALLIARETGNRRSEGVCLGSLGIAYRNLSRVGEAIDHYQQALLISREIGDRLGEGNRLGNLGEAYADMGRIDEALDHLQQALRIDREIGYAYGEGADHAMIGDVLVAQGNITQALTSYEHAASIGDAIGSPQVLSEARHGLALARLLADDLAAARQSVGTARAVDYPTNNAQVLALQGVILLRQDEPSSVESVFGQAIEAAQALLDHNAQNYAALDTLGLAQAGLALCAARSEAFRNNLVSEAVDAYGAARAVTDAPGIVADALRLLDALAVVDEEDLLGPVRRAAAGAA